MIDQSHPDTCRDECGSGEHRQMQRSPVRRRSNDAKLRRRIADEHRMDNRADPEQYGAAQ
jgi:hypothetical protein